MEREQRIGLTKSENTMEGQEVQGQEAQGFDRTLKFLRRAIAEKAYSKMSVRQRNVAGVYFGSPATEEEIGRIYGVTREAIRQNVKNGVRNLWRSTVYET